MDYFSAYELIFYRFLIAGIYTFFCNYLYENTF
ncbi:hypothetical protein [Lebetimonas sp. JH292]